MSRATLPDPIHYIDRYPLSELKNRAPRRRLQRFCWNLEVVREQIPEGFNIREAELCLSENNQGYISAKLDSTNKPKLHATIRGLMAAHRIDRGATGLFRDYVLYDNRGRLVNVRGNAQEQEARVPRPEELHAGLDIRTIYATGVPPLSEEEEEPRSHVSSAKGAIACAILGAVTTAAGIATWLILRRRSSEEEEEDETEDEATDESDEDEDDD